jgi:hypothetical protein
MNRTQIRVEIYVLCKNNVKKSLRLCFWLLCLQKLFNVGLNKHKHCPGGVVYLMISSPAAADGETGAMGREIESRLGVGWWLFNTKHEQVFAQRLSVQSL